MALAALEEKLKIELKKKKIKLQEELIKDRERKARARRCAEIGKLASKAEIDHIDESTLLGAFLEIAERKEEANNLQTWKRKSAEFLNSNQEKDLDALIISFSSQPDAQVKSQLKEMNFKWNSFRKEYYGFGNKKAVEAALRGVECNIDVVDK